MNQRAWQRGISLIETMVGLVIGLVTILVIGQVMAAFEGQKRTSTGGGDAQTNGLVALQAVVRDVRMAGVGLTGPDGVFACDGGTHRSYNGVAEVTPAFLPPVRIIDGGEDSDAIVVFRSVVDGTTIAPSALFQWTPNICVGRGALQTGSGKGELFLVSLSDHTVPTPCTLLQMSAQAAPGACVGADILQLAAATGADFPYNTGVLPTAYSTADGLVTALGANPYVRFLVEDNQLKTVAQMRFVAGLAADPIVDGIVYAKAHFGIDTDGAGAGAAGQTVDRYIRPNAVGWKGDDLTVANAARIKAVRIALVARSQQYEKDEVSPETITLWTKLNGADDAPPVFTVPDRHYRYRVFETVVPLRTLIWANL